MILLYILLAFYIIIAIIILVFDGIDTLMDYAAENIYIIVGCFIINLFKAAVFPVTSIIYYLARRRK